MATYRVTAPDGSTYEINAPDDASEADVMAYAQKQFSAPPPRADFSDVTTTATTGTPERSLLRRAAVNLAGETGADTLDALQHNVMRPLHGAAQMVVHGINSAGNAILPAGGLRKALNESTAQNDQAIRDWEADYEARNPDNAFTYGGAAVGQVAPFLVGAGAKALQYVGGKAASLLPQAATTSRAVASGVAQGGLLGAVQPVTGDNYGEEKATQVGLGGLLGGALPGLSGGARAAYGAVRPAIQPQAVANEQLGRLLSADDATLTKLRNTQLLIPGEQPTTAQILQTPRAVQVEKALALRPELKTGFMERANSNNAARMNVLRGLAGTDDELATAVATRRANARAFTQDALTMGAEGQRFRQAAKALESVKGKRMSTADFDALNQARIIANRVQRGAMDEAEGIAAMKSIQVTSKTALKALEQASSAIDRNMVAPNAILKELRNLSMSGQPTIRGTARQHIAQLEEQMAENGGRVPAYALDDMRQNIGAMLAANAPNGAVGSREAALYGPVASKIVRTLDRAVPGYRDYLAAYRADSAPINTMQGARSVLAPVEQRGFNSAGDARLTLGQLNTGLNRIDRGRYGVTPEARQQLESLRSSLQRESVSNSVPSAGSDTAYNLQSQGWLAGQIYGPGMQGPGGLARGAATGAGALLGAHMGGPVGAAFGAGIGSALKSAADRINQRIASRVGAGMQNPQEAARMIEQFLQQNPKSAPALLEAYPQWRALLGYEASTVAQP